MTPEELATLRFRISHHKCVSKVVAISVERMESMFEMIDAQAAKIAELEQQKSRAERALQSAGWTYAEGAAEWRPPLGPSASLLLDRIDQLTATITTMADPAQAAQRGDHSMLREFARANLERLIAAGVIDPAKVKRRHEELNIGKSTPHLPDDFILVQRNPDKAVCLDGSRFHGWLMYRHSDGQFITERKLEPWELMQAEDQWHYGIVLDGTDQQKGSA